MRILANELKNHLQDKSVTVAGWVNSRRDHGGLIFIDLRDHTGIIQLVITPDTPESFKLAESVRDEYVLKATGTMRERAKDLINPNIETGTIELVVKDLTLLNKSEPLPVNTHDDGEGIVVVQDEEIVAVGAFYFGDGEGERIGEVEIVDRFVHIFFGTIGLFDF